MFVPTESILEVVIRGTIMYLGMFALLRVFRRQAGSVGIADLLVIVVIADAAQNGMAGESKSITEALILIGTIVLWDWFFDWLGFRSPFWERILQPQPLLLIENGRIIKKNLDQASNQIDATGVRTRAIERKLRGVETAPGEVTQQLLGDDVPTPDENDDPEV